MKLLCSLSLLLMLLGTAALAAPMESQEADEFDQFQEEAAEDQADDEQAAEAETDDAEERTLPPLVGLANPCSGSTTESKKLAGHLISQTFSRDYTAQGCQWVLPGSTRNRYTLKDTCATCTASGGSLMCLGAPLARMEGCETVRGPDCKLYFTAPGKPQEPCTA